MSYDGLLKEATLQGAQVFERPLRATIKGLYGNNIIWINRNLTVREKTCVLAEEIGHHHTSSGNILDQTKLTNRKQEKSARNWAYNRMVPLRSFISAYKAGIKNRYELAEYLNVIEDFLTAAIVHYQEKHGLYIEIDGYIIMFEPLMVIEPFE